MIVKNYNAEKIEKDFNELKEKIDACNESVRKQHAKKASRITVINAILIVVLIAMAIAYQFEPDWLIPLIVIASLTLIAIVIGVYKCVISVPEKISIIEEETFAMQFWQRCKNKQILSVEIDNEKTNLIKIVYENDDHIVKDTLILPYGLHFNTQATETYLDVESGYIIKPYQKQNIEIFQ